MTKRFVLYEDHIESINPVLYELLKNPPIPSITHSDLKLFFFNTFPFLHVLSEVVIFLRIFYYIHNTDNIYSGFRLGLPFIILCLSTILLFINHPNDDVNNICRLMILVVISIEILQSIIANLLLSVSDDTIYSTSVFLLLAKIASSSDMGNSNISLTSGMMVAIILATRLEQSQKVAMMLHSSMILFASFSFIQKYFKGNNNNNCEYIVTLILIFITFIASLNTPFLLPYTSIILICIVIIPLGIYTSLGPNRRILSHHYTVPHELN